MGVYIKDMEMPRSCGECDVICKNFQHGWDIPPEYEYKCHKDCPLVEVKAPHGDLVDREKVIDEMCVKYTKAERQKKLMYASVEVKQGFCDLLTDAPTVLEAEG